MSGKMIPGSKRTSNKAEYNPKRSHSYYPYIRPYEIYNTWVSIQDNWPEKRTSNKAEYNPKVSHSYYPYIRPYEIYNTWVSIQDK